MKGIKNGFQNFKETLKYDYVQDLCDLLLCITNYVYISLANIFLIEEIYDAIFSVLIVKPTIINIKQ